MNAKVVISITHCVWRDGCPRFVPGPALRALNFKSHDLKREDGAWMSLAECQAFVAALAADIVGRRAAQGPRPKSARVRSRYLTLAAFLDLFLDLPEMQGREIVTGLRRRKPLSPATVRYYKTGARVIAAVAAKWWDEPAAAIGRSSLIVQKIIDDIEEARGLAMARCARALLSAAFTRIGKHHGILQNPCLALDDMPVAKGRARAGTVPEMRALIAAADASGRPEIGDMVMLGLFSAHRQGDRLQLTDALITERQLPSGAIQKRLRCRQSKTGAIVDMPLPVPLLARLEAAQGRRRLHKVQWPHLVIDERAERPWAPQGDYYRHVFAQVRDRACLTCPSLKGFRDQDLRDTAATWGYDALAAIHGADLAKSIVKGLTGHKGKESDAVLERHYLDSRADLADEAVLAVTGWLEQQGGKL